MLHLFPLQTQMRHLPRPHSALFQNRSRRDTPAKGCFSGPTDCSGKSNLAGGDRQPLKRGSRPPRSGIHAVAMATDASVHISEMNTSLGSCAVVTCRTASGTTYVMIDVKRFLRLLKSPPPPWNFWGGGGEVYAKKCQMGD